jgi:hypothetical protein
MTVCTPASNRSVNWRCNASLCQLIDGDEMKRWNLNIGVLRLLATGLVSEGGCRATRPSPRTWWGRGGWLWCQRGCAPPPRGRRRRCQRRLPDGPWRLGRGFKAVGTFAGGRRGPGLLSGGRLITPAVPCASGQSCEMGRTRNRRKPQCRACLLVGCFFF